MKRLLAGLLALGLVLGVLGIPTGADAWGPPFPRQHVPHFRHFHSGHFRPGYDPDPSACTLDPLRLDTDIEWCKANYSPSKEHFHERPVKNARPTSPVNGYIECSWDLVRREGP